MAGKGPEPPDSVSPEAQLSGLLPGRGASYGLGMFEIEFLVTCSHMKPN